jgi:hypothetical protein
MVKPREVFTMDNWLRASSAAAIVLAGAGVFYHLVIHLPAAEQARREDERARTTAEPTVASRRHVMEQCQQAARLLYDIHWASACMVTANHEDAQHALCLRDPATRDKAQCDKVERTDPEPDCTLPGARAAPINAMLRDSEARCLVEAKNALAP